VVEVSEGSVSGDGASPEMTQSMEDLFGQSRDRGERVSSSVTLEEDIVGSVRCDLCSRQFATTDKRYVADRDEWVLENACVSKEGKLCHKTCFMMRQKQTAMESDSDREQLVPVLMERDEEKEEESQQEEDGVMDVEERDKEEEEDEAMEMEMKSVSPALSLSSMSSVSSMSSFSSDDVDEEETVENDTVGIIR